MHRLIVLSIALLMDFALGEPGWFFLHPVRIMGKAIEFLERVLRGPFSRFFSPRMAGVLLCVIVAGGAYFATMFLANRLYPRFHWLGALAIAFLLYTTISLKGLVSEAGRIAGMVSSGGMEAARLELKSLVGRDTAGLDEDGIIRAAVESLAENASDGVLAPIFFYLLGGLPMAMAYKAVNTMDSMVGYKNERYIRFGWAAARLDDIANFIPARLTGFFICLASAFTGRGAVRPLKTMFRDGARHPSPNSGMPMAAMAGALGVTLGGPASYGGTSVEKPLIGAGPAPAVKDARMAMKIVVWAALIGAALMAIPGAVVFH